MKHWHAKLMSIKRDDDEKNNLNVNDCERVLYSIFSVYGKTGLSSGWLRGLE